MSESSSASLQLRPRSKPEPPPPRDWPADAGVVAVRADWRAMSVVHFVLVFRKLLNVSATSMLDCVPERAVALGCTLGPAAGGMDADDEDEDENENEDEDDATPAPTSPRSDDSAAEVARQRTAVSGAQDDILLVQEALVRFCIEAAAGGKARRRTVQKAVERLQAVTAFEERVHFLYEMVSDAAETEAVRAMVLNGAPAAPTAKGKRRPRGAGLGEVAGGVRLQSGARDANDSRYIWVRGLEGCCSGRVEISDVERRRGTVVDGPHLDELADRLEGVKAPRSNRLCGAWVKEKRRKAEQRTEKVIAAAEKARKVGLGGVRINGEIVTGEGYGRGRRTRKVVEYVEVPESDEEEEEEEESDAEVVGKRKRDDDDFVVVSDDEGEGESEGERSEEGSEFEDAEEIASLREAEKDAKPLAPRRAKVESIVRGVRKKASHSSGGDPSTSGSEGGAGDRGDLAESVIASQSDVPDDEDFIVD